MIRLPLSCLYLAINVSHYDVDLCWAGLCCVLYELQFWGKLEREYANDDFTVMLPRHLTLDDFNDVDDLDNDDHDDASVYVKSVPVRQNDQHRRMTEMTWLSNSSHSKVPRHQVTLIGMTSVPCDVGISHNLCRSIFITWMGPRHWESVFSLENVLLGQKIRESWYSHDSGHRRGIGLSITGENMSEC